MTIKTHNLDPEDAYDETQTNDDIESGDTLVAGKVVGFMMDAWPVAVTADRGQFHMPLDGKDPEGLYEGTKMKPGAIAAAVEYARKAGLELAPVYTEEWTGEEAC